MDIIGTVRNWVGRLAELGVSLLALTIVAELLGLRSVVGVRVSGLRFARGGWFSYLWTNVSRAHVSDVVPPSKTP